MILSQVDAHAVFGGVVPEIAARAHVEALDRVIAAAMREAGARLRRHRRGGGDRRAGADRRGDRRPDHGQGDRARRGQAARRGQPPRRPRADGAADRRARRSPISSSSSPAGTPSSSRSRASANTGASARTIDDALGEAFDKAAKLLGLGYPGGPEIEAAAERGDGKRFALPRPLLGRPEPDFSLSGLKTALRLAAEKIAPLSASDVDDLAASFQAAVTDVVADRAAKAMALFAEAASRLLPSAHW